MMIWRSIIIVLLLVSCGSHKEVQSTEGELGVEIHPKYASLFCLVVYPDKKELILKNPWDSTEYDRYIIEGAENKRIIALSGSSIGFLSALNVLGKVKGVGQKRYVYQSELLNDEIIEVGESHQLNIELLINSKANYLFTAGFEKENKNLTLLKRNGLNVISTLEWMENHPLARAEWLKFYGVLLGKEERADSLFSIIETEYLTLANLKKRGKPSVMLGNSYKEVWYTPSGGSYMAKLIEDAGGDYFWRKTLQAGSLALSVEDIMKNQLESLYWINPGSVNDLGALKAMSPVLQEFKPVKVGEVYNYNKRKRESGGNDYWETGTVYPHLLLKDYIQILHPNMFVGDSLYYYEKLK